MTWIQQVQCSMSHTNESYDKRSNKTQKVSFKYPDTVSFNAAN